MRKFLKNLSLLLIIVFTIFSFPKASNAASIYPSENSNYRLYDYVIDSYDVYIRVNENNTFDVVETINVYFNTFKHGIYRVIPLNNTISRLDGTKFKNRVVISNLEVNNEYSVSRENGNYKVQIGSPNRTLTGKEEYIISYNYNIGKDPIDNYDEFYFNIIGTEWDTVIGNVTFTIEMPKEFDSNKLGFSHGLFGDTDSYGINYTVNGNIITGSYDGILEVGEALTIRTELPEGYFVDAGFNTSPIHYVIIIMPIVFLLIAIMLWYMYGRDEVVVETVEFYPPQGFNSLEIGFLYKGNVDNQDVVSLLIYLANCGYIKISEIEHDGLFTKKKGFKITKLKEYDGNNINERLFLNGLFTKKETLNSIFSDKTSDEILTEVTDIDLYDNFYKTMGKIINNVNSKENKNKIFEKKSSSKRILVIIMIIITYCLITVLPIIQYGQFELILFALLFPGIGFTVMISMLFSNNQTVYVNGKPTNSSIAPKIFGLVWGGLFGGVPWAFLVLPTLLFDNMYLVGYLVGLICIAGMIICNIYLPKRTPYGNEILGKLKGFRNFLITAEKENLEAMVMQNPTYFYDILPYTYVLGVSDKWIEKFETISLKAPDWYDSTTGFTASSFGSFMSTTMSTAQSSMSSSPSGGGSSGGGSSGGGSGGGGGGSW